MDRHLGTGVTTSISELASIVRTAVGYDGALEFDRSKPDGMPFKELDSSALSDMGWRPRWDLRAGVAETYRWLVSDRRL